MKFKMSSKYGALEEFRTKPHTGVDLSMPEGTKLRSLIDGVVEQVYNGDGNIGKGLKVTSEDGTSIIYGHMSDVDLSVGDTINKGDFIGLSGNTGHSTGPHLHFGMKENGEFIDPSEHIESLTNMSGELANPLFNLSTPLGDYLVGKVKTRVRENAEEMTKEIALGILEGLGGILVEVISSVALVGGGILVLLKVAGYEKGYKHAGVLFVISALLRYLLGGM